MPHESRLNFSAEELLANVPVKEPLIVNGVRCHGGFDADGVYRSPRTAWRVPAIEAWQERHVKESGMPLFEIPADAIPPQSPGVEQAKFLLRAGVREPMVRILSEIAIVEGFGAMIREIPVPPPSSYIRENTAGTTIAHLHGGLFEAQARDEAGWTEEGGHRQMWEAARDAALSNPAVSPQIFQDIIARRMGEPRRMFPQLDAAAERLLRIMVNILVIEVFAAGTFSWAEAVLSDPEVSDAPEAAANLVRYIRSDEAPHVEYLRTALSEIQARTLFGPDGSEISGQVVVEALAERSLRGMLKQRFTDRPTQIHDMIRRHARVDDLEGLLARFDALAPAWTPPARYLDLGPGRSPN